MSLTYESSGVNYEPLDAFKRACQRAAATTTPMLERHGLSEPPSVRGESAYLIETPTEYLAHVEEGLGTKNLVADAMQALTGKCLYRNVGIDTVATIVNDLITTGALPISVAMHAGVGDSDWFKDTHRAAELAEGFAHACRQSQCVWGGGETPALKGIIHPDTIVLAGSAIGRISPKELRVQADIQQGDVIILLASTGVQTNGLSLCRKIAEHLPQGYLTKLPSGRAYGEVLLDASAIYVSFVTELQRLGVRPHYLAHITGHGWRKIMRADLPLTYRMTDLGRVPEIFDFLMKSGPIDLAEAYATFNMGAGFAAYVSPQDVHPTLEAARLAGHVAWVGGHVTHEAGRKAVILEPAGITFEGSSLAVR